MRKLPLKQSDYVALRSEGFKRCPRCSCIKPLAEFYKSTKNKGSSTHCAVCMRAIAKERHKKNARERKDRYSRDREKIRDRILMSKFGISLLEYRAMLELQGGVCAICGGVDKNKSLAVDHDHRTGKVRGLLCGRCNPAIGFLTDCTELAKKLISYIEKANGVR